jgi:translation initiation factor IF-1
VKKKAVPHKKPNTPVRRRRRIHTKIKEDKIYFDGRIVDTFPSAAFGVTIERKNDLPPLYVKANLKTALKLRRVMIIKGDRVKVELDPIDMASEDGQLKGTIVERMVE